MVLIRTVDDSKEAREVVRGLGEKHPILGDVSTIVNWGAILFVLQEEVDGPPLSINVTYFGRKKISKWQPYANSYVAYTHSAYRREGYAKILYDTARGMALDKGCRRLKSLACTKEGLAFHSAMGDTFWGIDTKQQVVIDTALTHETAEERSGIPPSVRRSLPDCVGPWKLSDLLRALQHSKLRFDE